MASKLAKWLNRLGTETAFELLAKAKQLEAEGRDIIHLEIGEPDFMTPKNIRESAKLLIDGLHPTFPGKHTGYTGSQGDLRAREVYAEHLSGVYGVELTPDNLVITPGAKPILFFTMLILVEPGDEVIYPDPGYPIYSSVASFLGAELKPYHLREENGFRFDPGELEELVTPRTKLIVLNTPANPTGGVLTREDLDHVWELAEKYDCWILADEIYSRIVYEGSHISMLDSRDKLRRVVICDGHSKTYAMTGWRLGYVIANQEICYWMTKLMVNAASCTANFTQFAGADALTGDQTEVEQNIAEFRRRRDLIVSRLNSIEGVTCVKPRGAFYVFPNFKSLGKSSRELEDYFLNEYGVACLAGTAFGPAGEGYMRFSYANSYDKINQAMDRIEQAVAKLRSG